MQPVDPIWRRHDAHRFIRHDAHRFFTPAGLEEQKRATEAEKAAQRAAAEIDIAALEALRADHERVRIELAEVTFALALRRICRKYSPDQPRAPAGGPDGGQWTSGANRVGAAVAAGGSTSSEGVILSDATPDAIQPGAQYAQGPSSTRYTVDLKEEEARGGHTLRDHVGKSDEELLQTLRARKFNSLFVSVVGVREGSFASSESANDLVNRTLERNAGGC